MQRNGFKIQIIEENDTILKSGKNGYFHIENKTAKNMRKTTLEPHCRSSMQFAARKMPDI